MTDAFSNLANTDLRELIAALRSRRIGAPYSAMQVSRALSANLSETVASGLSSLESQGFTSEQIVSLLEILERDRLAGRIIEPPIDLVTSGPEAAGVNNRDTAVVVRELFAHANKSVLVVGYAVYQGERVFEALAKRMEEHPDLQVDMYLDVARPKGDTTLPEILVSRFAQRFKDSQWPQGHRLPRVFYDPRSIDDESPIRSSLHAKCIVVDAEHVFVSSANFTEAAQQRNIEVGLKIQSPWLAERLIKHFKLLSSQGLAVRAF